MLHSNLSNSINYQDKQMEVWQWHPIRTINKKDQIKAKRSQQHHTWSKQEENQRGIKDNKKSKESRLMVKSSYMI